MHELGVGLNWYLFKHNQILRFSIKVPKRIWELLSKKFTELESERKLRENMDAPAKRAAKKTIKINIEKNADIAFWITAKT